MASPAKFYDHNGELRLDGSLEESNAGIVLTADPIDIHAIGQYRIAWNAAYDTFSQFNQLTAVPAALGLSINIVGGNAFIGFLEPGLWSWSLRLDFSAADTDTRGNGLWSPAINEANWGPIGPSVDVVSVCTSCLFRITDIAGISPAAMTLDVQNNAVANPYAVAPTAEIIRLG